MFNVKMDFSYESQWILDGHKTSSLIGSTLSGTASKNARIAFTCASLNGLEVFVADIIKFLLPTSFI